MKKRPKKKISIEVLLGKGTSFTTDELAEILRQLPKVEEE